MFLDISAAVAPQEYEIRSIAQNHEDALLRALPVIADIENRLTRSRVAFHEERPPCLDPFDAPVVKIVIDEKNLPPVTIVVIADSDTLVEVDGSVFSDPATVASMNEICDYCGIAPERPQPARRGLLASLIPGRR